MREHWESVVSPLLVAVAARVLVEVGIAFGLTTTKMLEWVAAHDGVLHGIDPLPRRDVVALADEHADRFVLHRARSLEALPEIRDADFVLLDGDHNWFTVHRELQAIERVAREEGRPYPLTVLHDVDWPYGRRDMYYDPDTIPAQYRHEFAQGGVLPGVSELGGERGLNARTANAVVEGTPRNGVRTAVEDFIAGSELKFHWSSVPGFHGAGILADATVLERTPGLRETLDFFESAEFLEKQCRTLEASRLETQAELEEARRELRKLRRAASARADGTRGR
jgi:Methyltransferase domain